ncbi:ABC-type dipeptide transport system, periplasmic component [Peptoclostridium acidaminophilum DSM 3953]|uniref:ABC-type dipeptide transport system, periplasmic component n=1 Tax=Peptoclostridium acidaminophilum DSM 3953 TaxID=1286171 RepID=W8U688_PEPAC|nr:ABC-type dipeptide transport system, periplasmic component [Peptoclostridium acidaminophilum DSM 3953]
MEKVSIVIVPDAQAQKEYFQSQEIDFYNDEQYYDKKYGKLGINVYDYFNYSFDILAFNLGKGSFADEAFRNAMASAVDRQKIADEAYMGAVEVADMPLIPKSGSKDKKSSAYKYAPESTKAYFKKNPDKKVVISLLVNSENEQRVKAASLIKKNLADAGLEIEIVEKPWEEYSQDLKSGNYEMALAGYKLPATGQLGYVIGTQGGGNFMGFSDPNADILISGIENSIAESEKSEKTGKLQSLYNSKTPYLGLVMKKNSVVVNSRISGALRPSKFNVYSGIEDLVIENQ